MYLFEYFPRLDPGQTVILAQWADGLLTRCASKGKTQPVVAPGDRCCTPWIGWSKDRHSRHTQRDRQMAGTRVPRDQDVLFCQPLGQSLERSFWCNFGTGEISCYLVCNLSLPWPPENRDASTPFLYGFYGHQTI